MHKLLCHGQVGNINSQIRTAMMVGSGACTYDYQNGKKPYILGTNYDSMALE